MRDVTKQKASRYLVAGAVTITRRTDDRVEAVVSGDTGRWTVTVDGAPSDPRSRWRCSCRAGECHVQCSHAHAVRLVVLEEVQA